MLYTLRFFLSSKCSLFHNANLFGSCSIHILYTGCAEIKKNNSGAKGLNYVKKKTGQVRTNVTFMRVRVTIPSVQKGKYLIFRICVCILALVMLYANPTFYLAGLYYHLRPVWPYYIVPRYLTVGKIFGKIFIEPKMCFDFFPTILSDVFLILRTTQRYIIIIVERYSCEVAVIRV